LNIVHTYCRPWSSTPTASETWLYAPAYLLTKRVRRCSCECRRCRRERESESRTSQRDNMTYCLIDELTGRNESWTINANDVLSFARQIAIAMVTYYYLLTECVSRLTDTTVAHHSCSQSLHICIYLHICRNTRSSRVVTSAQSAALL